MQQTASLTPAGEGKLRDLAAPPPALHLRVAALPSLSNSEGVRAAGTAAPAPPPPVGSLRSYNARLPGRPSSAKIVRGLRALSWTSETLHQVPMTSNRDGNPLLETNENADGLLLRRTLPKALLGNLAL